MGTGAMWKHHQAADTAEASLCGAHTRSHAAGSAIMEEAAGQTKGSRAPLAATPLHAATLGGPSHAP